MFHQTNAMPSYATSIPNCEFLKKNPINLKKGPLKTPAQLRRSIEDKEHPFNPFLVKTLRFSQQQHTKKNREKFSYFPPLFSLFLIEKSPLKEIFTRKNCSTHPFHF